MRNQKLYITTANGKKIRVTELELKRYRKIKTLSGQLQIHFKLLDDKKILFDGCKNNKTFKSAVKYLSQKAEAKQKQDNSKRIKITNQRLAGFIMFNRVSPKDVLVIKGNRAFYFDPTPKINELTEQYNTITNKKER